MYNVVGLLLLSETVVLVAFRPQRTDNNKIRELIPKKKRKPINIFVYRTKAGTAVVIRRKITETPLFWSSGAPFASENLLCYSLLSTFASKQRNVESSLYVDDHTRRKEYNEDTVFTSQITHCSPIFLIIQSKKCLKLQASTAWPCPGVNPPTAPPFTDIPIL